MPSNFGDNNFGVIDYIAVGATLIISLVIGFYQACSNKGKQTNEELLMGSRKMSALPIGASMLVTYLSAIAIIGYPAEIYSNGIQIFWIAVLLTLICIPLSAYLFMTVLYKLKLTSVYEYFQLRFDSPVVKYVASGIFIIQMTILTGVALYAPTIPLEAFLGLPAWLSVVGIGVCGTLYTSVGGLKAVVYTDVFQFVLIIIGMMAIVIKGFVAAGGVYNAFDVANQHGRLVLFDWTVDPFQRYNTLNFIIGYGLAIICFYGAHQPNVQRYSSLPTFKDALKAMAWNGFFKEVTNILIIFTGVSLFATYAGCDPIKLKQITKADQIVPHFFIKQLAFIPGMIGLFTSCIFSAVLSTLSSALNSLAAVTWQDFLSKIPYFSKMSSGSKARVSILISVLYGIATMGLAFAASGLGSIFQVTITVIGATAGTLGGTFLMGLFIPCVNKYGAVIGMLSGLGVTGALTVKAFLLKIPYGSLPTTIDSCPEGTNFTLYYLAQNATTAATLGTTIEWPEKIFTVSNILYPFIGTCVTMIVGVVVSLITTIFVGCQPKSNYEYLHPLIQSCCGCRSKGTSDFTSTKRKAEEIQPARVQKYSKKCADSYAMNGTNGIHNPAFVADRSHNNHHRNTAV